ncbi:ATP-binding protein [Thalassotalea sp. 1_MG-2023]|uniref:sensor histidine kinase n=1 Tax=Thalassotalea sp. 1_MG-2023 TaxID=3062680 RepID=UPI0026E48295|nr:ATP-binding protein [Thalassotalea sp. 1_MG-2023]MDO6428369.1 ATP-binding protein [Thalassotalea sp. 1_MG-2023]
MSEQNTKPSYQQLEQELLALTYSEKLQHALFKIASISHDDLELQSLYQQVHQITNAVIEANNFFIALLNEEEQHIELVYFVDEKDVDEKDLTGEIIPLDQGLTSYVIKTRIPQLLNQSSIEALIEKGKIKDVLGSAEFTSWIGAPMLSGETLHGVIVAQTYQDSNLYTDNDLKVLNFVANQLASAIESHVNESQRRDAQHRLAEQHRLLKQQNKQLNITIKHLQTTQQELVQKEKMASLGGLVAGIAHEINTPLGICVTGVSHLMEEFNFIKNSYEKQTLSEESLQEFFAELEQGLTILKSNTIRGAALVKSFKQVAVDQSSNETRNINVKAYIDEILLSLKPKLKRVNHQVIVECPEQITMNINAGALSQILSNLILNSLIHGFAEHDHGRIQIVVRGKKTAINIHYADNGKGLTGEQLSCLFEPFFTTKRGQGGSGLGTHLIYNLVQSLKGKIKVKSEEGKGLAYLISLPYSSDE